eukprot:4995306-Prymnesium_polylepis.3
MWQLTLFSDSATWKLHAAWLLYAIVLAVSLTYLDDGQKYTRSALELFDGAMLEFRVLSAFVLAGFITLVMSGEGYNCARAARSQTIRPARRRTGSGASGVQTWRVAGWRRQRCFCKRLHAPHRFFYSTCLFSTVAAPTGWRERRANYATLTGSTKALLLTLASTLPMSQPTSISGEVNMKIDVMDARRELGRWVRLALELTVLKARGHSDSDEARAFLEGSAALCEADEWSAMRAGDRATTYERLPLERMLRYKLLLEDGFISHIEYTHLLSMTTSMRQAAHDLMARLSTDLPVRLYSRDRTGPLERDAPDDARTDR